MQRPLDGGAGGGGENERGIVGEGKKPSLGAWHPGIRDAMALPQDSKHGAPRGQMGHGRVRPAGREGPGAHRGRVLRGEQLLRTQQQLPRWNVAF